MAARACKKQNPAELVIFNPSKKRKRRNASKDSIQKYLDRRAGKEPEDRLPYLVGAKFSLSLPEARRAVEEYKRGKKNPAKQFDSRKAGTRADLARFVKQHPKKSRKEVLSKFPGHRRRNPSDNEQAVKLFESFHGKDAQEVITAQRSAAMRLDYTALGPLVALGFDDGGFSEARLTKKWDACFHLNFNGGGVILASAPNGKQLYLIGGDQNLDGVVGDFENVDVSKDFIDLGSVYFVVYEARKVHDNFEPADYCHRLGKGDQGLPRLAYDKLKKEMLLIGGEYFISTKAGISPGIEG